MEPVEWFLGALVSAVAVEGSIGAVQGAVKTIKELYESGEPPKRRAANAFVTSMFVWVSLGLTMANPILVIRILARANRNIEQLIRMIAPGYESSKPSDRQPRLITMEEAKELFESVKNISPKAMAILVAVSLLTSGVLFGITLLVDLAENTIQGIENTFKIIGGAVNGAIRRIGKWFRG